ncbi:glycosyltransferase family 8 protein [Cetobacterium sp.]|uniref:glycosyltransferase family 8 protein n=1 Tax=Cetobacterium sp. TaxID=2071632 RepID=UPI002FC65866
MNLVLIINERNNYARHLGATLISVLMNSKEKWNVKIIYSNLSDRSRGRIEGICCRFGSTVDFIKIDESILKNFKVGENTHLDIIVFGRLYIPEFLKDEKKAIYIDCDIIVEKPLENLYNSDFKGKSIITIPDGKKDQKSSLSRLGLSLSRNYFNAGVMVMDLEKIRENKKFIKTIEFSINPDRELQLNEQDALNIIFEDDFTLENVTWNYTHGNSEENNLNMDDISLIHYTGSIKPWDCRSTTPFKKNYWRYLNLTPWKGYSEENRSLKNILVRELVKFKLKTRKYRYIMKFRRKINE